MEENIGNPVPEKKKPTPKKKTTHQKKVVETPVEVETTSSEFNEMDLVESFMMEWGCDTDLKRSLFFTECEKSSEGFSRKEESLGYTSKELKEKFPKWFPLYLSGSYGGNPEKIGNRIYERKIGNGPESSGDGWKFRGRGYLNLRGRMNYEKFSSFVEEDLLERPEVVSEKYPYLSSLFVYCTEKRWEK
jgi:putative chitinase